MHFQDITAPTLPMCDLPTIEHDLLSSLNGGFLSDEAFSSLAQRVFQYQFQNNVRYHKYCLSLGVSPENLSNWHDIPAIPTDVFKLEPSPLISFPKENTQKTFLTSGTTTDIRGQHHFPSLGLYETSITSAWQELKLPRPQKVIFLTPSPDQAPQSSLSHMMGVLSDTYAETAIWAIDETGKLDTDAIIATVKENEPVAILGTALAFLHLFDRLEQPIPLPSGSWAMETGGYKGTDRQMEKEDLYRMFGDAFGLDPQSIINEYSMTELSSQFYTRGLGGPHSGPSWTRVRVIDPFTNTDAKVGEPGHLVIYDLANLYSVMAIRTQDLAIQSEADLAVSNNSFTLLGRDPSALPRGCSRAADHQLRS